MVLHPELIKEDDTLYCGGIEVKIKDTVFVFDAWYKLYAEFDEFNVWILDLRVQNNEGGYYPFIPKEVEKVANQAIMLELDSRGLLPSLIY